MTGKPSGSSSGDRNPQRRARPLVLLDTNALLLAFRAPLGLDAEIARSVVNPEVRVPSTAVEELAVLARRGVRHASAALALAGKYPVLSTPGRGDAAILAAARRCRAVVVTADRRFAERLRTAGVATLVPRDRARLQRVDGAPVDLPRAKR